MGDLIAAGILTAIACFIIGVKADILKVAGYHISIDVFFTVGLALLFSKTYSGLIVAVIAGICLSLALWWVRYWYGYKRWYPFKGWVYNNNNPAWILANRTNPTQSTN